MLRTGHQSQVHTNHMWRKMQTRVAPGTQADWNGTHYEALLTPRETGGKFGAFASDAGPGNGPPRHRHPKSDEVFVILQGRLRFWCAGEASERTAGEVFHIPAGVEHTFVVVERARWIAILSPGGLESFFPTVAAQGLEIPRDLAEVKAIAAQFDMEITGPPLVVAGP
ncbi:cupin domain-containing protein [Mesorhizobium sp.]|uniref:cupin domain-containing protein n=1 Tax=Mesorhizobium sp. TaxID=1871066 RepID=UPI0011F73199|nr:cupin domain-containing protein [Mesorhizobium sp.]TIS59699.1 MAG: cupin domain-containing protein [Mesorhizobium sp.]TIS88249.1 MAG: cupin domain-containing protein [Mesorhizobium sp.]